MRFFLGGPGTLLGLPELSKTHSSLTRAGRERRGNATACIPLGQSAPLGPPGIRAEVRFSLLLAHLCQWFDVVQGAPGSPSECGSQNSSCQGTWEICKTKWERSYLHSRYEQAEDLCQGSTPSPPSIGPCCACQPSLLEEENTSKACSLWDQGPGQTCGLYTHTSLSQRDGSLPLTSITVDKHYLFNKDAKNFQSLTHREEEFGKNGEGDG